MSQTQLTTDIKTIYLFSLTKLNLIYIYIYMYKEPLRTNNTPKEEITPP